jgi:hypothetical protein
VHLPLLSDGAVAVVVAVAVAVASVCACLPLFPCHLPLPELALGGGCVWAAFGCQLLRRGALCGEGHS